MSSFSVTDVIIHGFVLAALLSYNSISVRPTIIRIIPQG